MGEKPGQRSPEGVVGEEDRHHPGQHRADAPTGGFQQQGEERRAGREIGGRQSVKDVFDALPVEADDPDAHGQRGGGQGEVPPARAGRASGCAREEGEDEDPGQVDGPEPGRSQRPVNGLPEVEEGERGPQESDRGGKRRAPGLDRDCLGDRLGDRLFRPAPDAPAFAHRPFPAPSPRRRARSSA